jgi:DNA-directed RNA polymerase specialized sigma24 family protein
MSGPRSVHRDAESVSQLVKQIAGRDRRALRRLHRRLVHQILTQARTSLGDTASAAAVTRAVFLEVWRLAPISADRQNEAVSWLTEAASRRIADRLCVAATDPSFLIPYDEHVALELAAALGRPH